MWAQSLGLSRKNSPAVVPDTPRLSKQEEEEEEEESAGEEGNLCSDAKSLQERSSLLNLVKFYWKVVITQSGSLDGLF